MNTRPLSADESQNLARLNSTGRPSVLLYLTRTGLEKGILDATEPMRKLLAGAKIHDFSRQEQGPEHKVVKGACFVHPDSSDETKVSLYRPKTKDGDPRFWFAGLPGYARPDDVLAVFVKDGMLHLLNLSQQWLAADDFSRFFLEGLERESRREANELLEKLRAIARRGAIRAVCEGDTAIGRSIETALGIQINSSRNPDYHGIELKSGRSPRMGGQENRANLFACVADWSLSTCKGSREILEKYGYRRGSDFKLYCTVSCNRANSQGLQLKLEEVRQLLREFHRDNPRGDVCIWPLPLLHERLSEKHKETFWIQARSLMRGRTEYFELQSVVHTTRPSHTQFDRLLDAGNITVDHLIKKKSSGSVVEKGPLFKIEKNRIAELFYGLPRKHALAGEN